MKKSQRSIISVFITLIMLFVTFVSVHADDNTAIQKKETAPFKLIYISQNSYIQLNHVAMQETNSGKIVTYTLELFNRDHAEISFIDYWTQVRTNSGSKYDVKYVEEYNEKVLPQTSNKFTFYTRVSNQLKLQDLNIDVLKWDFNAANFQRTLGHFTIPASYSSAIDANTPFNIEVSGEQIETKVMNAYINSSSSSHSIVIEYTMKNLGRSRVTLPEYEYSIVTRSGHIYPLESNVNQASINPLTSVDMVLTGSIPGEVDAEDIVLYVFRNVTGTDFTKVPVASYQLPHSEVIEGPTEKEQIYNSALGEYTIKLNSVQRLPWEDTDIISADISLINNGTISLPVINLDAYYELDGIRVDVTDLQVVKLDKIIGIAANQQADFVVYSKVPYTYEYSELKLVLEEKSGNANKKIAEFTYTEDELNLPLIREGQYYHITNVGNRSDAIVKDIHTYIGETSDTYYVELELVNKERRHADISKLNGYFRTSDDIYYPANISAIDEKVSPNGSVLISLTSSFPKGYNFTELELILGQGLIGDRPATFQDESDAFMKAAIIELSEENVEVDDHFNSLNFSNFEVNLTNFKSSLYLNGSDLSGRLSFKYDLTTNNEYEVFDKGHKLQIEFVDEDVRYSKSLTVGDQLQLGTGTLDINIEVEALAVRVKSFDDYTINIYDEYDGKRKLIASRELQWFKMYN